MVVPAGCLCAIFIPMIIDLLLYMIFAAFSGSFHNSHVLGLITACFVWGGSMMAPTKHWAVRTTLFFVVAVVAWMTSFDGRLHQPELIELVGGGVAGIVLDQLTLWLYQKFKKYEPKIKADS